MGSVRDTENIFNPDIFLIASFKVWNVWVVFDLLWDRMILIASLLFSL